jgi:hypothetical protein
MGKRDRTPKKSRSNHSSPVGLAGSKEEAMGGENLASLVKEGEIPFLIGLIVEEGKAKHMRVLYLDASPLEEDSWEGWQEPRLVDFIKQHAGLHPPAAGADLLATVEAEQKPEGKLEREPITAPLATPGLAPSPQPAIEKRPQAMSDMPYLREFETIPVYAKIPSWVLEADQPFDVHLTLDLTEMKSLEKGPIKYEATFYVRSLTGKGDQPQMIGKRQGSLMPAEKVPINIDGVQLQEGSYHLYATVGLITPFSMSEGQPYSTLQSMDKRLEVY